MASSTFKFSSIRSRPILKRLGAYTIKYSGILGQTKQGPSLLAAIAVGHQQPGDHAASHPQVARLLREGAQQQHVQTRLRPLRRRLVKGNLL